MGRTRTAAALLSIFPVLMYGLLAGMSPSTQRAVIMVSVFLMTFLFDRKQNLVNTIAVAALVIVVLHPPTLFSISFQLSFAAVLSIAYGFAKRVPERENLRGTRRWITTKLTALFLVSVFATLGTLPLVMHYFNQVSLVGVAANVIAVPLIGFVAVPVGLVSVFMSLISQTTAVAGLYVCAHILSMAVLVVDFFAELPFAAVNTVTPNLLEISCYYILMGGAVALASRNTAGRLSLSRKRWGWAAVAVAVVLLLADTAYWVNERFLSKDFRITIMDVGQGSAALLELPGGVNYLLDGGGFSDNSVFDVGERIVAPYLWHRKIMTVDGIVLSHPNSDHMNGLIYIAEHFNVKQAWTNGETAASIGFRLFSKMLEKKGVVQPDYKDLAGLHTVNAITLEILSPEKDFLSLRKKEAWRNANNNSIVMKAGYGRHSFLFPGDIMSAGEARMVKRDAGALESSVLIAPHHGSRSSSSTAFLKHVDPDIVVISAGWRNRFKFPHVSVLRRYDKLGCRVYRTDLDGAVILVSDGETLTVKTTVKRYKGG
jgi:competence protein ComEC